MHGHAARAVARVAVRSSCTGPTKDAWPGNIVRPQLVTTILQTSHKPSLFDFPNARVLRPNLVPRRPGVWQAWGLLRLGCTRAGSDNVCCAAVGRYAGPSPGGGCHLPGRCLGVGFSRVHDALCRRCGDDCSRCREATDCRGVGHHDERASRGRGRGSASAGSRRMAVQRRALPVPAPVPARVPVALTLTFTLTLAMPR
jgi:hypothetical protein